MHGRQTANEDMVIAAMEWDTANEAFTSEGKPSTDFFERLQPFVLTLESDEDRRVGQARRPTSRWGSHREPRRACNADQLVTHCALSPRVSW